MEVCNHSMQSWMLKNKRLYCEDCESYLYPIGDGYYAKQEDFREAKIDPRDTPETVGPDPVDSKGEV
jgi:hypothetical protein